VTLDQPALLAGRYRLLARIGSGGMGVVWSADDELLGRRVAVKEVHSDHESRMKREAQVGARVCHPNVVPVYDLVYEHGKPWLIMRLVPSRSLAAVIADDGPLLPQQAATMGRQLLAGLTAVHAQGILHCDVKPGNVLVDERHEAHLTDFGIAADTGSRMVGTLFGAPAYIAPERVRGLPMGPPSDLWSLGATLYTAVEGHAPLDRGDALATVTAIVRERPAPPLHAGGLRPVLDGLLAEDPALRPTATEVDRMLRRVAADPVTAVIAVHRPAPAAASTLAVHAPARRKKPALLPLTFLGLSASAAAAAILLLGGPTTSPEPSSPVTATVGAPPAAPEAAAIVPPAASTVATPPAHAPAQAPVAYTPSEPVPTTTGEAAPPVTTTSSAVPTTTSAPTSVQPTTTSAAPPTTEAPSTPPAPPSGP
jgi:serine/threonine protein kinase